MAVFTMTVSDILGGDENADTAVLGLDDYPIFDESHRSVLNQKIVRRYWTREIGIETTNLWRFKMRAHMHEVMPYFNQLWNTTKLEYDPLSTVDMRTISEGEDTGTTVADSTSDNTSTSNSKSRVVGSEFPQTQLNNSNDYASSATDSVSDTDSSGESSGRQNTEQTGTSKTEQSTSGRGVAGAELVLLLRETLLNVDTTILDSLEPLFMQVWSDGSSYFEPNGFMPGRGFFGYPFFNYR